MKLEKQQQNLEKQKAILIKYMKEFQEKINLAKDKNSLFSKIVVKMNPVFMEINILDLYKKQVKWDVLFKWTFLSFKNISYQDSSINNSRLWEHSIQNE